jgi:AcrR family transcriptional regulator
MARPTVIDNETILKAARGVFLRRGLSASTADVAKRAGISHGSVFKRFKTKSELFHAAMLAELHDERWLRIFDYAPERDFCQHLREIAGRIAAHMQRITPFLMLSWADRCAARKFREQMDRSPHAEMVQRFEAFFRAHRRAGSIADCDARTVVLGFIGALHTYTLFELWYARKAGEAVPIDTFINGFIDTLWRGLDPQIEAKEKQ